jgi:hypothetical protein
VTEIHLRIQKLKLRLRGLDEPAARALADGLGEAIVRAVHARDLIGAGSRRTERIDLGSITAAPGATPDTLRGQVASAIGAALTVPNSIAARNTRLPFRAGAPWAPGRGKGPGVRSATPTAPQAQPNGSGGNP